MRERIFDTARVLILVASLGTIGKGFYDGLAFNIKTSPLRSEHTNGLLNYVQSIIDLDSNQSRRGLGEVLVGAGVGTLILLSLRRPVSTEPPSYNPGLRLSK